jgi:predicted amidohydrolase YtcJ
VEPLIEFEEQGILRIRTTIYLGYISNCGEVVGDWVKEYPIDRDPSHMLRFGGIKLFSDGGSCMRPAYSFDIPDWAILGGPQGDLFWSAEELTTMVREFQAEGYQVAIHAIGDRALETVLNAYENALEGEPNIYRHRIEHNTTIRPEFLPRYSEIGVIPIVAGGSPACRLDIPHLIYTVLFDLYPETYRDWFTPTRKLLDANPDLPIAWHSDRPALPGFPIRDLFSYVTKKEWDQGSICDPPDWLAAKAITVEEALRIMTINGAYALFMEEKIGSLKPGKYADLVILSENPLTIPPDSLIDLQVLLTMVGGNTEYCMPGHEDICP